MQYLLCCSSLKFLQAENKVLFESDCQLEIDFFCSQAERQEAMNLMNLEIEWGLSWPFEEVFPDFASFSKYFMSHSAFVVRVRNYQVEGGANKSFLLFVFWVGEVRRVPEDGPSWGSWVFLCEAKLPWQMWTRLQWRLHSQVRS